MSVPCRCCPTSLSRCWAPANPLTCPGSPTITADPALSPVPQTVLVANPAGLPINSPPLSRTADGDPAGGSYSGFNTPAPVDAAQGVIIDYVLPAPLDRVMRARLWNNGGGILTDNDGLGPGTIVELFDPLDNLLVSGPLNALNGGGPTDTVLAGAPYGAVAKYRLRNLMKLNVGTVKPLWRDIRLVQAYHAVATWTCPPITITADILSTTDSLVGGITFPAPGLMTQTNGPHSFTFNSPDPFTATISAANPGDFSTLAITNGTVVTVSGNHANAPFSIEFTTDLDDAARPAFGMRCDDQTVWYDEAGNVIAPELLRDCP